MRYLLILFTILSIYFSVNVVNGANYDELHTIAKVIENNNYIIKEWGIISRKPIGEVKNEEEFFTIANEIKKKKEEYTWKSIEDDNHHFKLIGVYENKQEQFLHRIIITAVKNNEKYKVEMKDEVKGYQWNPQNINIILEKFDYQSNKASSFYNFKGEATNISIGEGELVKKARGLMENLSAKEVENLVEDYFVSLSALSTKWENKITLNANKEMNLQIGMRFSPQDNKISVTVGTPIIISEY